MLDIVKGDIMERIISLQESQEFERVSIDPSAFNAIIIEKRSSKHNKQIY